MSTSSHFNQVFFLFFLFCLFSVWSPVWLLRVYSSSTPCTCGRKKKTKKENNATAAWQHTPFLPTSLTDYWHQSSCHDVVTFCLTPTQFNPQKLSSSRSGPYCSPKSEFLTPPPSQSHRQRMGQAIKGLGLEHKEFLTAAYWFSPRTPVAT